MLLRRIAIQNVRSFLDRTELKLDGPIAILIGPNGGGKTNLLDTAVIALRRYLFASMYSAFAPTPEQPFRYEFRRNEVLDGLTLERHSNGVGIEQVVEVEVEVTSKDLTNMRLMSQKAAELTARAKTKYANADLTAATKWNLEKISEKQRFVFRIVNGRLQSNGDVSANHFQQYLQLFEMDGQLREEFELAPLAIPLVYLPVNRSASAFQSKVELAGYDDSEVKRRIDGANSRSTTQIVSLAVGRMAKNFRMLLEKDKGGAAIEFMKNSNLVELTKFLKLLGYHWSLETINALKNEYDVKLEKQGSFFLVSAASSGERELLTYLFAIFALNVRDALIIVDEPELHLHPKWQKILLQMFIELVKTTGNQFVLATHSPTFISPGSIQYVSRVFSHEQRSNILRLDTTELPQSKHLLNIINSQNNERLFFADEVVLVEGVSDRIFFEAILDRFGRSGSSNPIVEVISVGGKGFFEAYASVLRSCSIKFAIVADLDYIEQVGPEHLKALFEIDARDIKADVIDNVKSLDAKVLVNSIDEAMCSGNWGNAQKIWEYIKSRRRKLHPSLRPEDSAALEAFIASKQADRLYILGRGSLEDYLPVGHHSKDLDKLIQLLEQKDFWEKLPAEGKNEIEKIARSILRIQ
jgi:putative ATP-dependent endonuclease of OLD family